MLSRKSLSPRYGFAMLPAKGYAAKGFMAQWKMKTAFFWDNR